MSAVPEVKRFDPHQPRDRKGRWVETGAEVRNSITRALGTVTRVIRGDNFHENSYEVRTTDGQTQHWETSAIDVVRNRDGSNPSEHAPGTHPAAPGAHHATPAARSAAAGAIGEVYAGHAPDKPQAGHSPVDHAVDAVYGQPHPDRPARVADAVGNVYAAQAPDKPQAGRTPVSHAVDATHGTPAAPAARPDLGGAIDAVYGDGAATASRLDGVPPGLGDWERTKPWNATREDVQAGRVSGFTYSARSHGEDASHGPNGVVLTDKFFDHPESTRRAILYHEAGHALGDAMASQSITDFQRLVPERGGHRSVNGQTVPHEAVAEAYSLLNSDTPDETRAWVESNGLTHFVAAVANRAHAEGLPVTWTPDASSPAPDHRRIETPHRDLGSRFPDGAQIVALASNQQRAESTASARPGYEARQDGGHWYVVKPPVAGEAGSGGLGVSGAPAGSTGFRGQLDDRWHKDGTVIHPHTTLGKLQPGDRIHTEGQGTQASPVTLAKPNPSNGVIPANRRKTRTVAHVQRNPDSTHTVHFTDGTSTGTEGGSNIPVSDTARSRVYAADAPDAIVAGGERPPAPVPGPDVTPPAPDVRGERVPGAVSNARIESVRDVRSEITTLRRELDAQGIDPEAPIRDVLLNRHGTHIAVARDENGRIIGGISYTVDNNRYLPNISIDQMRVQNENQRQGVGQDLIRHVAMQSEGMRPGTYMAVHSAVGSARPFYVRTGADIDNPNTPIPQWSPETLARLRRGEPMTPGRNAEAERDAARVTPPSPDGGTPAGVDVPEMGNYRDAARFITEQIGDPAIERDLQVLLSGRMNRDRNPIAIEATLADHPEAERIQAMVALVSRGHPRATTWKPEVVREGLQRYIDGDPTLPANAIGSSVAIDVRDTRPGVVIRLGPNATSPTRRVNGIITAVEPVRGQSGHVYIRLRDDSGAYHFETYPADMRLDVQEAAPQRGSLAAEVRDVRRAMTDMQGMPANDRIYQAVTLQSLVGGNVSTTEAHARVDLVRNNVIDATDGSERHDATLALDRLDAAIDVHAGGAPTPPDSPAPAEGERVRAHELNVGDQISYTAADGTVVTGEIEGLHTTGPNVVATLRMPDDRRETRAFRRDAEVNRTATAAPPVTEDVSARDLRMGQRFMLQDASGAYRPATVLHVSRESGGSALVVEVSRDDGTHETTYVDPSEVLPRITDRTREPDLPPMPDPAPEDGTKFASGLRPGDRIASYGDSITVVRARVAADGLVHARVRLANGAEDDVTYTPDATVTLADPPSTVDITPHTAGTATTRPTLYTYQRNGIVALNLDAADSAQPPLVQQAAARVRNRQALSEEQSAALADALRAQATAPGVRAPRQRTLQRQAAALDAAAAAAGGRVPPVTPNRDTVEKTRPANLVAGDWVALRGQGAAGGVEVVQVLDSRAMMGGRLHELTVRDADGNQSRRLVAGNADTYLLPDLPRDLPAAPEAPRSEHVTADRIAVGDTIRIPVQDANYNHAMQDVRVTDIRREPRSNGNTGFNYRFATSATGPDGGPYWHAVGVANGPQIVRLGRGAASQDQPYDSLLPAENPERIRDPHALQVGDRVQIDNKWGAPTIGMIHAVDTQTGEDGKPASHLLLREDNGQETGAFVATGDPVTRLSKGDAGAAQRIAAEREERERDGQARLIADEFEDYRGKVMGGVLTGLTLGAGTYTPETHFSRIFDALHNESEVELAQRNLAAGAIARRVVPGDRTAAQALQGQISAMLAQARADDYTDLQMSIGNLSDTNGRLPGETTGQAVSRVAQQWSDRLPPRRNYQAVARTLVDASRNMPSGQAERVAPAALPNLEGASLDERMKAYREALPNGAAFGKVRLQQSTFGTLNLDNLEAGRPPEVVTRDVYQADRAADGGPGAIAMQHHDIVMAAGRDLDAQLSAEMKRIEPGMPDDPAATLATLSEEYTQAAKARDEAAKAYYAAEREARTNVDMSDTGFDTYTDLRSAESRARYRIEYGNSFGGVTEQERAEAARLAELRTRVEGQMQALYADAKRTRDLASDRSLAAHKAEQHMRLRVARVQREAAIALIKRHRQVGGVQVTWVERKRNGDERPLTDRSRLVQAMRQAEEVYPTDWLQRHHDQYKGKRPLKEVKRGFHMYGGVIALSEGYVQMQDGGKYDDVAVHELGHGMESTVPGLLNAQEAYLWSRTSQGEVGSRTRDKLKRLADIRKDWGYKNEEITREDDFPNPYMGKHYGERYGRQTEGAPPAFELLTMGSESLFAGSKYLDEPTRQWLLGTFVLI